MRKQTRENSTGKQHFMETGHLLVLIFTHKNELAGGMNFF